MTYREKLQREHPEQLREDVEGGCVGCPDAYGYEPWKTDCLAGDCGPGDSMDERCRRCWDREIKAMNKIVPPVIMQVTSLEGWPKGPEEPLKEVYEWARGLFRRQTEKETEKEMGKMTERDAVEAAYRNGLEEGLRRRDGEQLKTERLYGRALEVWGRELQSVVAVEELSEAAKEICKGLRGAARLDHMAEEIADAQIMLEQMTYLYGLGRQVRGWRLKKLRRLEARLDEAEKKREGEL